MIRRSGALVILAALYFVAAKIGDGLGQTLTIISIFCWTIAVGLVVYLVLFKGMRINLFEKSEVTVAELNDQILNEKEGK